MSRTGRAIGLLAVLAVIATLALVGEYVFRRSRTPLPQPGSAPYEDLTRRFYHGLAALQVGLLDDAKSAFAQAAALVPDEPAAWANLAVTDLRLGDFAAASPAIARAAALAPENGAVAVVQGQLELARGRLNEGIQHLRRAVDLDPQDVRTRYALAQAVESGGGPGADADAQAQVDQLVTIQPDNLALLVDRARLATKRRDAPLLRDSVVKLARHAEGWPVSTLDQFRDLERAAQAENFGDAARAVAVFRNVLLRVPAFREDLAAVKTATELIADPLERFVRVSPPVSSPSPSDDALTFSLERLADASPNASGAVRAFSSTGTDAPTIVAAGDRGVRRIRPAGLPAAGGPAGVTTLSTDGLLALDWNRDFRMDLVLAGRGGLRLLVQGGDGQFRDDTARAGLSENVSEDCFGAWTADLEMDGDLDIVVGLTNGAPVVLRNNGDGTWRRTQPFEGVIGLRGFVWGDLDGDGDPDAALLDAQGALHLFENRQGGAFAPMTNPMGLGSLVSITIADVNGDGTLDLVTLDRAGAINLASWRRGLWEVRPLATWSDRPDDVQPGGARLLAADLDNNGAIDLVVSGAGRSTIWLADAGGRMHLLPASPPADVVDAIDLNGDGQLDLIGLSAGQPVSLMGRGTKGYHWQVIRPRAQQTAGDQRINSFGLGAEIEIRSGPLVEKQIVTGTAVHFGLGTRTNVDVARIVWPNGVMQADFDSAADRVLVAEQRLKGSCPWVFTWDGRGMEFVTDFLWRSPLGLRINAQDTADVTQTEDWVKIRGDQLVPRDDAYDVRITAELWETHFIDHVSLMTVDHPADVEVFVDERFAREPPLLATHVVEPPQAVARAWDERGREVTNAVTREDGQYLSTFARGVYQGVAEEHFVEFELGREIPAGARLWLLASGWIYPTDSSINVAIGQGRDVHPRGLSLEAEDGAGQWIVIEPDLGFPAGKNKTILIDLTAVARAGVQHPRRLRLRTNLEIYWDRLATAADADARVEASRLDPRLAVLRYRGFSKTTRTRRDQPETPRYAEMANLVPRWRDLVGYYTRFGDVRELLTATDDRYVIMNAGDELELLFPVPPAPPAGWRRDFVLIGDGWVKDGDYNTSHSKDVLPLPSHDHPGYDALPEVDLEDDPVYRHHPQDWQIYHTRFVAPRDYLAGLR